MRAIRQPFVDTSSCQSIHGNVNLPRPHFHASHFHNGQDVMHEIKESKKRPRFFFALLPQLDLQTFTQFYLVYFSPLFSKAFSNC